MMFVLNKDGQPCDKWSVYQSY